VASPFKYGATGLPITSPKLWFSKTIRKTWSADAAGGGGLVTTLETPPHPAQIKTAKNNKDVESCFMVGPLPAGCLDDLMQ
jgi:hypothetical protein